VYEFGFQELTPDNAGVIASPRGGKAINRLAKLRRLASRIHRQGWPVQLTVTGVRFQPPDDCAGFTEVRERLADLDITELFIEVSGRTLQEIHQVWQEFADRVWYARRGAALADPDGDRPRDPEAARPALRRMSALEQRYGKDALQMEGEKELVWAEGVLAALSWVMGDELEVPAL
jgi:hypothetical protein